MSLYRNGLPQLDGGIFLTDGGLETTLIFHQGVELPLFAAFDLLKNDEGAGRLRDYFRRYAQIADRNGYGFILESPTWRASRDWGLRLGYDPAQLAEANRKAIVLLEEIRGEFSHTGRPFVISGCFGPRGDGYKTSHYSADEARDYHLEQMETFADTAVDLVSALTMTNINEAIGIALAAKRCELPVAISFTVETDARLPGGETLAEAIIAVDRATANYPAYYMINCAHPTHFEQQLPGDEVLMRLRGIRANASKCSHAELDESPVLDDGDPREFGEDYARLKKRIPGLTVLGGCCGTDHRHIEGICERIAA
ncbi:MAG TPA: homocysteine S-methyltransferase family protein [Gammaproteobacteria bacterium]